MRVCFALIAASFSVSCGGAAPEAQAPAASAAGSAAEEEAGGRKVTPGSDSALADHASVAFRADFANLEAGRLWNVFGGQNGNREVKGGADGLWVKIAKGERPWDAVGLRTAKLKVDGDFDLRGRFRDFSAGGNGAAKLIVVDAASSKGEAAYVERIQIDGKNLFKFGGEIEGSSESWGFAPTDVTGADLRLVRKGDTLHAFARADENVEWKEFAPAQPTPKMARVLKVGVKLSSDTQQAAQVRWEDFTLDGKLVRD
jgi:hypothetical protein